jgi:hypothetical protein
MITTTGRIQIESLDPRPDGYRDISQISRIVDADSSLCDPVKGAPDASTPRGDLSVAERNAAEIAVHGTERKMRKACTRRSCRGRGLPSIIPAMMFSRARRSTRITSACVVFGLSLKDSIRQYRFPPTSLIARRIMGSSNCRASAACIAPARQYRPSLSRSLPLHHCCSFISKRSTSPSLASGVFSRAPNSVPSRGISFLRVSRLARLPLRHAPDGPISPAPSSGSATRQPPVFCRVPNPSRKFLAQKQNTSKELTRLANLARRVPDRGKGPGLRTERVRLWCDRRARPRHRPSGR